MQVSSPDRYRNIPKVNQHNNSRKQFAKAGSFKGGIVDGAFNVLDKCFSALDKNAMIQVSFVDTVSTNIPRTLVDLKTGLAAALETCRREFSGLFVNCLMPSFVVMGIAGLLPKGALKGTGAATSWANGDSVSKLKETFIQAQNSGAKDTTREYVRGALTSLSGLDGKKWVDFASHAENPIFQEAVDNVTQAISSTGKTKRDLLKSAREKITGLTKTESVLRFKDKPQANLEETLRDITDLGSKFNKVKERALSQISQTPDGEMTKEAAEKIRDSINNYSGALKKFVNKKSLIGLALVIAIAVSVQKINRAITRKQFKAEGAPIYKDFGKKDTTEKMDDKQKRKFAIEKGVAAAGMYGLAALSMMKKPSLGMFQFSGFFPTMDQCRWIASSTFASRILAAEDRNELRESTIRDIASFSGLYFLGDYVKKGVASGIEAISKAKGKPVELLNRQNEVAKPVIEKGAGFAEKAVKTVGYRAKQFGNWVANTSLKTSAEVATKEARNLRNICRVADIAFSIVMLGVLLPKYNRKVTEKKVAAAKLREENSEKFLLKKNNFNSFVAEMRK
ncbi:hypothetical protein II906_09865 [bacterium]|nr:hypothetical protein [bacterium]